MLYLVFVCGDASEVRTTISRTHIGMFPQGSVHSSWGSVSLVRRRRVGGGSEGEGWTFALGFEVYCEYVLISLFISRAHDWAIDCWCFFTCFFCIHCFV